MILKQLKMSAAVLSVMGLASIGGIESPIPFIKPAMAQKGSRLCGWYAPTQVPTSETTLGAGAMAIVVEARPDHISYTSRCDAVVTEVKASILADPLLSTMSWIEVKKVTCESVGQYFVSATHSAQGNDMCDYMKAWGVYNVKKYNSPSQTNYTKTKQI